MTNVIAFPGCRVDRHGTIHVLTDEHGRFGISHESASGDSWGGFETFPTAATAIAAAYQLNESDYGGACDVFISPDVLAALPPVPVSPYRRGDF